ncbi:MAG: type VI secretion system contractile sheath domain-containing protein [Gammaproteobacteria bacterium]
MTGRIDFEFAFPKPQTSGTRHANGSYRIYILGNFSRRSKARYKITAIDIDNFDEVMEILRPTVEGVSGFTLSFENLDAFHPDVWLKQVPILVDLLALKTQLSNPATAQQAAAKIMAFLPGETQNDTRSAEQPKQPTETNEETLERLFGKKSEIPAAKTDTVDRLIEHMVSPYVSKEAEPQHRMLIDVIDATMGEYLRMVLHDANFQRLEAVWRAVAELVREEGGDGHDIFLIDVGQTELLAELNAVDKAFEQTLSNHIQLADGEQQVLLLADYYFSASADDLALLGLCSRLANRCRGSFLGGADASLLAYMGDDKPRWEAYLRTICADNALLAYPRYLLRLPYGQKTDTLETLVFEECSEIPQAHEMLWGSPVFLMLRAMIRLSQGYATGDPFFFDDIPCFTFERDGEQILQPGVEVTMTENQANALVMQGIMPLVGYYRKQGVRLMALSPLASAYR